MENIYDIKSKKNLNYILPMGKRIFDNIDLMPKRSIAVFIHLYYLDTSDIFLDYVKNIPENITIFFTVSSKQMKQKLEKENKRWKIIEKPNRGRDISAFLVACREEILKYEYICFLHDKKEKSEDSKSDNEMWITCLWENMIGSSIYIDNLLQLFKKNENLGLLVPPSPLGEHQRAAYENTWYDNFQMTEKLAGKMNLVCDLNADKSPITLGTVFWTRVSALKKLFEIKWEYDDFDEEPMKNDGTISHAIERVLGYAAQDAGYDTGWVMTDRYAGKRMDYIEKTLKMAFDILESSFGISDIKELNVFETQSNALKKFADKYRYIYIYGAGEIGQKCLKMLYGVQKVPAAFLVSDVKQNPVNVLEVPVYSIHQINLNDESGIIIGVSKKYQEEVIQEIKKRESLFANIYLFNF